MTGTDACDTPFESDVRIVDRMDDWKKVLSNEPFKSLVAALKRKYPKEVSLTLDYRDIQSAGKLGIELADEILEKPLKVMEDIRDSLWTNRMITTEGDFHCNVRFTHLPRKTPVRDIRADDIGKLISVEGIIRKASEVRPRLTLAVFRCKAGHRNIRAQGFGPMVEPDGCQADGCNNKKFELLPPPHSKFIDSQRLKLQELPEGLRGGEQPESIDIDVLDDICASVTPGTRVILNGIVKQVQRRSQGQLSTTFDIYIECNSIEIGETDFDEVEIRDEDEEEIKQLAALPWILNPDTNIPEPGVYSKIAGSIAPSIFGITHVKRAIALQMFSGIPKELPDGSRIRGDIHVLMIGDPGIAKSQLIKYVTKLVPRSVYTSGKSASAAGLTASAVKDEFDGRWTLEAGAFVMADKGIMGLDEIEKCDKSAQSSIHEAMEQQCYDEDTEILTVYGWMKFSHLDYDTAVATLNPKTNQIEYHIPDDIVVYPYSGEMCRIKSRQVDLMVTPNHRLYVSRCIRADNYEPYHFVEARDMKLSQRAKFKRDGIWKGSSPVKFGLPSIKKFKNHIAENGYETGIREIPIKPWLRLLGYFLSEGSVHGKNGVPYRVSISQVKPETRSRIFDAISSAGYDYKINGDNIVINDKQLATYCSQFGLQPERFVPDFVKGLSPELIREFLKTLVDGDGHVNKKTGTTTYVTSSKRLADDVQELLLKCGISGNIVKRNTKGTESKIHGRTVRFKHDTYVVSFIREQGNTPSINQNGNSHITTENYSGRVHCVTVQNHIIYVRRNGIPVWCGNSISVAKAGITASLQCRCSVLAAGNPAMGRFDDYSGLAEQFNMPPSLLSRFDLIYLLTDKPEKTRDEMLAWHILNTHQYGEELVIAKKERREASETYSGIIPGIPPVLLRKYVAYAKANVHPKLSREAMEKLTNYFMSIRNLADSSDKPVPVTARAIEALIRLAEAAARMELSPVVTEDHASLVIQIVDESLKQVAYDPKTDTWDIDRVVSDKPKSQRDMIRAIEKRFDELKNETGLTSEHELINSLADEGHSRIGIANTVEKMKKECIYTEKKGGFLKRL